MDAKAEILYDLNAIARITAVPGILEAAARTTGMRFTAVAKVTDTTWTACAVHDELGFGLAPGGELLLETTICDEIRRHHRPVVFGHASRDPVFSLHHTPKHYGLESYLSVPIFRVDGSFFGTLCAIDSVPADLSDPNVVRTFELFAELIGRQLEIEEQLEQSDQALRSAEKLAVLREQLMVLLGRDIRDPLQSIITGLYLLDRSPGLPVEDRAFITEMAASCTRISDVTRDALDLASGRLGTGIPLSVTRNEDLSSWLSAAIARLRVAHPDSRIESDIRLQGALTCDPQRVEQALDNLVRNAIAYGDRARPIQVRVHSDEAAFHLSVHNFGEAVPAALLANGFEPYARDRAGSGPAGLGLGLFIVAEIAKAHAGSLTCESTPEAGTRFVCSFPIDGGEAASGQ